MVRIRFRRVGGKKQPSYRLVAANRESSRDGRFLENLGFYNPRTEPTTIQLSEDRIFEWMKNGAQLSPSAEKVLSSVGTLDRYARYKDGEDLEVLLAEAEAAQEKRSSFGKTSSVAKVKKVAKAETPEE
jgi:small subunit ribosomal protein S16